MSVTATIYSNANTTSATVTVDFVGDVLVQKYGPGTSSEVDYYFKFTTGSRDTSNVALPVKTVLRLTDLALNSNVQSEANTTSAYANVNAMVNDYVYDYVHGHTANQYLSGCSAQKPLKFR